MGEWRVWGGEVEEVRELRVGGWGVEEVREMGSGGGKGVEGGGWGSGGEWGGATVDGLIPSPDHNEIWECE